MEQEVELLVVGAGPFGLSLAAYAIDLGVCTLVAGKPMEFWKDHMPQGMYLRSASDWYLDAGGVCTIEQFLQEQGLRPAEVEPLSRDLYLSYAQWFQERKGVELVSAYVTRLDYHRPGDGMGGRFQATLADGGTVWAHQAALAVGFAYFRHIPPEYADLLPAGCWEHTCDLVDFSALTGKRCLILGGRQSAYEWAALLHEAGAAEVHVSHRHPSPTFTLSDWSWVTPITDAMVDNPAWFRNLPIEEQDAVVRRMWAEGRLKLEPWLADRIQVDSITLWPQTVLTSCTVLPDGSVQARLDNGECLVVDQIILATGYKVRIDQVPFLAAGNIMPELAQRNGFPALDERFQTSLPGLFVTSIAANQDFGPFFGFTVACRTSARIIGRAVQQAAS
jgi:FAD-dependent urate hydroxylase